MNWSLVLVSPIIAVAVLVAVVVSAKEFSGLAANRTVANMAATLLAARLRDTKYMDEVEKLRQEAAPERLREYPAVWSG